MKPVISPVIIFRTPKFSWESSLLTCWPELKNDIALSSANFFESIKEVEAEQLADLPYKTKFTIWKYFNRARFRATPFGTLGAFGIAKGSTASEASMLKINPQFKVHKFINWPYKNNLQFNYAQLLAQNIKLFSNSSYYVTRSDIRFVNIENKQFQLDETEKQDVVLLVLENCLTPIPVNELIAQLGIAPSIREDFINLLQEMIELQLLFTEMEPNIIGKDYFGRIGLKNTPETTPYIISEVLVEVGEMDMRKLRYIPELMEVLGKMNPDPGIPALAKFAKSFKQKFEQREIPLMMAIDPEIGIGYDELEHGKREAEFIEQFSSRRKKDSEAGFKAVASFLAGKLDKANADGEEVITITDFVPDAALPEPVLPNTFNSIIRVVDELVFIDSIGSTTANSLNGRFTLASEEMLKICRETAYLEAASNPGVLFFDVGYMAETEVDNINRRAFVYDYQLSVLNYDTSENPLTLNDIFLSVQGDDIILRSKKLNKRLVPRMASAYNYGRSDLSLFRLLCDLQHQGIQSQLSLPIEKALPGKNHYPRIQYKNLILSPQKWKIQKQDVPQQEVSEKTAEDFRRKLTNKKVSRYFKAGLADQTLCFDSHNTEDIAAFIQYASRQAAAFFIEEVLLPEQSVVEDTSNKPYLAQFVLTLQHTERVYRAVENNDRLEGEENVVQFFPPGSEWIYFEVFCHAQRSDTVLLNAISETIHQLKPVIGNWFFIRYSQHGEHLRIRLQLTDMSKYHTVIAAFNTAFKEDMESGLISDLQLKTYRRETARYGNANMLAVEKHFSVDSYFALSLLALRADDIYIYKLCISLVMTVQQACFTDIKNFIRMISAISDSFNEEHNLTPADFKKLNAHYQLYLKQDAILLPEQQLTAFTNCTDSFIETINNAAEHQRSTLFLDMFHMHVNRLFSTQRRSHEMVIYYFLLKDMQRIKAMQKH